MTLPIVAKCKKCGRDFLTLPADGDMTDRFYPQGTPYSAIKSGAAKPCCGEIVPPTDTGSVT